MYENTNKKVKKESNADYSKESNLKTLYEKLKKKI